MTQLLIIAFTMGIIGSFHCIGMCGPLALAIPLDNENIHAKFFGAFIYNLGRIFTYSVFGLVFGMVGKSLALFGFQQWLSVIAGSGILIYLFFRKWFQAAGKGNTNPFFFRVRILLQRLFLKRTFGALFLIGALNGLLPCGLVYMAITGAIAIGNIKGSILFMAAFGAGTLPAMWAVAFFGNFISIGIRKKLKSVYPVIIGCMGMLLIVRGLGLGGGFLSPKIVPQKTAIECCSKDQ